MSAKTLYQKNSSEISPFSYFLNRLSRTCGNSKENKSIDDDIDKPDCEELFGDKFGIAETQLANHQQQQQQQQQQQHYEDRSSSNSSNSINYLRQKQPQQRLPTSITINNVDMSSSKNEENDFFNPNRLSAKITVDVTVEFDGENNFKSQKMSKNDVRTTAMDCEKKQFL
jgi:hypothetical protein